MTETAVTVAGSNALKPREIAVLVHLRGEGRTIAPLSEAIGDSDLSETETLLVDMKSRELVVTRYDAVFFASNTSMAWLRTNDLIPG